jgi:hypothetical protein
MVQSPTSLKSHIIQDSVSVVSGSLDSYTYKAGYQVGRAVESNTISHVASGSIRKHEC